MQSWYELWTVGKSKHQELLREAERERLFNRLHAALQGNASPRPANPVKNTVRSSGNAGWSTDSGQAAEPRKRGQLAPDRLRPAER